MGKGNETLPLFPTQRANVFIHDLYSAEWQGKHVSSSLKGDGGTHMNQAEIFLSMAAAL